MTPADFISPTGQPIDPTDFSFLEEVLKLKSLGDVEGHDFHGNQYTTEGSVVIHHETFGKLNQTSVDQVFAKARILTAAAKRMDFPLEKLHIKAYDTTMSVGGSTFTEAAHFSPTTGEIVINANELRSSSQVTEMLLAHEVMHRDWHQVADVIGLEDSGNTGGVLDQVDTSEIKSLDTVRDLMSEEGHTLQKEDGITNYSKAYWRQVEKLPKIEAHGDPEFPWINASTGELFRERPWELENDAEDGYDDKFNLAVNETLAEISRLDLKRAFGTAPNGISEFDPSPTWRELHTAVKKSAAELRKLEIMTRGGFNKVVN